MLHSSTPFHSLLDATVLCYTVLPHFSNMKFTHHVFTQIWKLQVSVNDCAIWMLFKRTCLTGWSLKTKENY